MNSEKDRLISLEKAAVVGGNKLSVTFHAFLCYVLRIDPSTVIVGLIPQIGDDTGKKVIYPKKVRCNELIKNFKGLSLSINDLTLDKEAIFVDHLTNNKCLKVPVLKGFGKPIGSVLFLGIHKSSIKTEQYRFAVDTAANILKSVKIQNAFEILTKNLEVLSDDPVEMSKQIIDNAKKAIGCKDIGLWRIKKVNDQGRIVSHMTKIVSTRPYNVDMRVGDGLAGKCAETGEDIIVDDLQDDLSIKKINPDGVKHLALVKKMGWHAAIFAPLSLKRFSAGVLTIYSGRIAGLNDLDYSIMKAFASQIEYAYTLSETDRVVKIESHLKSIAPAMDAAIDAVGNLHDADDELFAARNSLSLLHTKVQNSNLIEFINSAQSSIAAAKEQIHKFKNDVKFSRLDKIRLRKKNIRKCFLPIVGRTQASNLVNDITINFSCSDDIECKIDDSRMKRALRNIVENSVYFLKRSKLKPKIINIKVLISEDKKCLVILVEDNGPGIPYEDKDKIFEIFYTTKDEEGFGLGLAMTQHTIDAHGGKISVDSRVGKGSYTKIKINLPYRQ